MFRKFLKSTQEFNQIELIWMKKLNGLIRVIIFDSDCRKAYVVVYYEQKNTYTLNAFCPLTGEVYWATDVPNGGYGAPAIIDDYVLILTEFTNITAICKNSGQIKWTYRTQTRIRSSINVINSKIYFSSGGTLYELNKSGLLLNQWNYPKAFFYGSIDVINELIITLGVINDDFAKSLLKVFAFHKNGQLVYELPICHDTVISTDTSGIGWQKGIGFVGATNLITAFQGASGKVLWTSQVDGIAGRQVCSVNERCVYYVTQSGVIGALNISDGSHAWKVHTQDSLLGSPISISGDKVIVAADAHLLVLRASDGRLVQKFPVGHSPYSMLSLDKEFGILGAGEPPHNGLIYGFKLATQKEALKYNCIVQLSNANIESPFFDIHIEIHNLEEPIVEAQLDGSNFYLNDPIKGEQIAASIFSFRVTLPNTVSPGDFVLALLLVLQSGKTVTRPIAIKLTRHTPLPSRVYLHNIPDIVQEQPNYSGAAIASVINGLNNGRTYSQKDVREMIDAVRDLSGYEPFQTWRIILRRVLTSQAKNQHELPEFSSLELTENNDI
ncbi:MAG: PQQ-binding-like beta-propeller repeat protein [Parachlamydiaceae bacterium]